ncbi:aminotransferase class V-fold PLP-dependent enzyme [Oculatella sp. LEGE 06141]|uniref:aminotransferase class V-fold PLP-dependent enzyme n=1 Tax=Oculatella sp. LEGE 06141 TaxID=1828648 RepID=UPI00187DED54|nr:aminotransferase class V-fold PLP-dependent enzyme [Oculatella sp. LEGE 06141]MBE9178881.1 aminotransferase class V-fold PLP-dependent enzyme [Oculatella sp. LEGE 06141]
MTTASSTLVQLQQHRQLFPALTNKAYFNYGGQGAMPQRSIAAIQMAHEHIQQVGPFSNAINAWVGQEANQMRESIASELGTTATTIALTEDVSVGCNIALWGIDWQAGDHLLLSDCEHPGIVAAALEIRRRFGVDVSTCPLMATLNDGDPVAVIEQHLRPTTRLVVISHILWNTGQVLPLAEISALCHQYPAQSGTVRVLVDAAQSVGVLPLNLPESEADFYAFTGHKWWCGPAGVGGLYVHPAAMASLNPTFIGWRGITQASSVQTTVWQPDARRYEVATSDYTLFAGLREAIAIHQQWGSAQERYQRIQHLSRYLWQGLTDLPQITCLRTAPPEAGLVSFRVNHARQDVHKWLVQTLEKQNIMLRTILEPDCVRACVHYFTLESELDNLIQAIHTLVSQ